MPEKVLDEVINHQELRKEIEAYQQEAKVKIVGCTMLNQFQQASYDAVITSLRPYSVMSGAPTPTSAKCQQLQWPLPCRFRLC